MEGFEFDGFLYVKLNTPAIQTITGPIVISSLATFKAGLKITNATLGSITLLAGGNTAIIATWPGGNSAGALTNDGAGNLSWASSGGVTSVTNSDGSLTIAPTTGTVVASLHHPIIDNNGVLSTWITTYTMYNCFNILGQMANGNGTGGIEIQVMGGSTWETGFTMQDNGAGYVNWTLQGLSYTANSGLLKSYYQTLDDGNGNMSIYANIATGGGGIAPTAIVVPASGTAFTNATKNGVYFVSGGTVTNIAINGTATGLTSGTFYLKLNDTITFTYTSVPTVLTMKA